MRALTKLDYFSQLLPYFLRLPHLPSLTISFYLVLLFSVFGLSGDVDFGRDVVREVLDGLALERIARDAEHAGEAVKIQQHNRLSISQ